MSKPRFCHCSDQPLAGSERCPYLKETLEISSLQSGPRGSPSPPGCVGHEVQAPHCHPGNLQMEGTSQHRRPHAEVQGSLLGDLLTGGPMDDDPTVPHSGFVEGMVHPPTRFRAGLPPSNGFYRQCLHQRPSRRRLQGEQTRFLSSRIMAAKTPVARGQYTWMLDYRSSVSFVPR
jgi:hypothetical protein